MCDERQSGPAHIPTAAPGADAAPTVLVVDDEPVIRELLEFALESEGLHVLTAADGIEAMEAIEAEPPAVVLTDLMMPRLDGYDLIAKLREEPVLVKCIFAMSAGHLTPERPVHADHFFAKPFVLDQVVNSILACLTHRQNCTSA